MKKLLLLSLICWTTAVRANDVSPFDQLMLEFQASKAPTSLEDLKGFFSGRCFWKQNAYRPIAFALKGATVVSEIKHAAVVTDNGPLFDSPPAIPAHSTFDSSILMSATARADLYDSRAANHYDQGPTKDLSWDRFSRRHFTTSWNEKATLSWEEEHRRIEIKKVGATVLVNFVEDRYDGEAAICYATKVMDLPPEHENEFAP